MNNEAKDFNQQGLRLVNSGRYNEAIDFFSKAIELDPNYTEAYKNRGEAFILLDRFVEGNRDIQKAKGINVAVSTSRKKEKTVSKVNMSEVDNLYDILFEDETFQVDDETLEPDSSLYDYDLQADTIDDGQSRNEIAETVSETTTVPASLQYLGRKDQQTGRVTLFVPRPDSLLFAEEETGVEQVVSFDQLGRIRLAGIPEGFSDYPGDKCDLEVIETVDGRSYQELVCPQQNTENLLVCLSPRKQSHFIFSLFPKANIKKRCQEKLLIDILVEKHFIGKDILNKIEEEYQHSKNLKIGKIIAYQCRIPTSSIETALDKAEKNNAAGLRTGEKLLAAGLVNERQVLEALEHQEHLRNRKMGQFLIEKGVVREKEIYVSLAEKHRIPFVDLRKQKISKKSLASLPRQFVLKHEVLPLAFKDDVLVVAAHYVDLTHLTETVMKAANCKNVKYVLSPPTQIRNIIYLLYSKAADSKSVPEISPPVPRQTESDGESAARQDKTLHIVNICYRLELIAHQTYFLLSSLTDDEEMKDFWLKMSEEENIHIAFWRQLKKVAERWPLPEVFENPDEIIFELESLIPKIQELVKRCKKERDLISSITLAYRLEFYLLHPALEVLFNFVGKKGASNPKDDYEEHINGLIQMLERVAEATPELELLGETLQRLWHENKKLAHQVTTDSLTNVLNRRGFFTLANHMAYLANRQSSTVGILMMDIDNFKMVNDTYGHHVGDIVLKKVAQVIGETSRGSDIIGRYGGEEFCIFTPNIEPESVAAVAERIREAVFQSRPNDLQVSISIGVVYGTVSATAPEDLQNMLQQADENLYTAKKQGKNRVIMTQYAAVRGK